MPLLCAVSPMASRTDSPSVWSLHILCNDRRCNLVVLRSRTNGRGELRILCTCRRWQWFVEWFIRQGRVCQHHRWCGRTGVKWQRALMCCSVQRRKVDDNRFFGRFLVMRSAAWWGGRRYRRRKAGRIIVAKRWQRRQIERYRVVEGRQVLGRTSRRRWSEIVPSRYESRHGSVG